jgi:hypothetical protein
MERREIVGDVALQVAVQVAGVLIMVGLVKWLMRPDAIRTLKMGAALRVKKIADSQVESWQTVAGKAANAYQKARV